MKFDRKGGVSGSTSDYFQSATHFWSTTNWGLIKATQNLHPWKQINQRKKRYVYVNKKMLIQRFESMKSGKYSQISKPKKTLLVYGRVFFVWFSFVITLYDLFKYRIRFDVSVLCRRSFCGLIFDVARFLSIRNFLKSNWCPTTDSKANEIIVSCRDSCRKKNSLAIINSHTQNDFFDQWRI